MMLPLHPQTSCFSLASYDRTLFDWATSSPPFCTHSHTHTHQQLVSLEGVLCDCITQDNVPVIQHTVTMEEVKALLLLQYYIPIVERLIQAWEKMSHNTWHFHLNAGFVYNITIRPYEPMEFLCCQSCVSSYLLQQGIFLLFINIQHLGKHYIQYSVLYSVSVCMCVKDYIYSMWCTCLVLF